MAEGRPAPPLQRRLQAWLRHLRQESSSTTRWSTSPSTAYSTIAYADLHKNQAEFARVAKEVDPHEDPAASPRRTRHHPSRAEQAARHLPRPVRRPHRLHPRPPHHHHPHRPSSPPSKRRPPFMRATTQASMDPPGPFETHSTKAYFNVTLPEPKGWTPAPRRRAHGRLQRRHHHQHSRPRGLPRPLRPVPLAAAVQSSKIRKLIGANTNIEGWAHYCEQMMLDEGYAPNPAPPVRSVQARQSSSASASSRTRSSATPASS